MSADEASLSLVRIRECAYQYHSFPHVPILWTVVVLGRLGRRLVMQYLIELSGRERHDLIHLHATILFAQFIHLPIQRKALASAQRECEEQERGNCHASHANAPELICWKFPRLDKIGAPGRS